MAGTPIDDVTALEAVLGEPMEFVRAKVVSSLNEAMQDFIRKSPLVFVSTIDENGDPDISPKGDPAGFVEIGDDTSLLIPERPGNRLTFGFRNILRNGRIGLIFLVPGQRETLRVKGRASLHNDPDIAARMLVNGKPALLHTRVEVTECFFHCGKALIRSHLWQPDQWPSETRSIAARGFASMMPLDDASVEQTEALLDQSYRDELY
ncbi:MAG: pyridoxamine 5'-phosphate oxidase family protein [Novosphingobium sp.]|nr:pyridoxamine 5'-phosphate oxidase family protein [Novosphingobium sp.]